MGFPVSKSLQDTVEQNDHIEEVHFTADGHHHFRVFDHGGKKYTRLTEIPEVTKGGISTNKLVLAPIKNKRNQDDEQHVIVETISRDEVLKATPVADKKEGSIKKQDILDLLGITDEDVEKILKSKTK